MAYKTIVQWQIKVRTWSIVWYGWSIAIFFTRQTKANCMVHAYVTLHKGKEKWKTFEVYSTGETRTWKLRGPWPSFALPILEAIWYTRGINLKDWTYKHIQKQSTYKTYTNSFSERWKIIKSYCLIANALLHTSFIVLTMLFTTCFWEERLNHKETIRNTWKQINLLEEIILPCNTYNI